MLAFPGVIYSQPLYFKWPSPSITGEYNGERKGGKETGRRRASKEGERRDEQQERKGGRIDRC